MTMGVLEKLKIRQAKSVQLPNGQTVYIRTLSIGEHRRGMKLTPDEKMGYLLGCTLVDENGTPAYPRQENETDAAFAQRVLEETDIDVPGYSAIDAAYKALEKTPSQKVLEGNSETTSTQT